MKDSKKPSASRPELEELPFDVTLEGAEALVDAVPLVARAYRIFGAGAARQSANMATPKTTKRRKPRLIIRELKEKVDSELLI